MKNIQVIDGAVNCVYDIFSATDEEFAVIFPEGTNIAFIEDVSARIDPNTLNRVCAEIWKRRARKRDAMGIHGILFYELELKKPYYPTLRDEEARNPCGSELR